MTKSILVKSTLFFSTLLLFSCKKDSSENLVQSGNYVSLEFTEAMVGKEKFSIRIGDGNAFVDLNNNQKKDAGEGLTIEKSSGFSVTANQIKIYGDFTNISIGSKGIADITKYPNLKLFFAAGITGFRSDNANLERLNIYDGSFSSIDLSKLPNLVSFIATNCGLTSVNISKNPLIEYFDVSRNKITQLDFSQNKKLARPNIYMNNIKSDKMQVMINTLQPADPKVITYAVVFGVNYPEGADGNVMLKSQVTALRAKGWGVRKITITAPNTYTEAGYDGQ